MSHSLTYLFLIVRGYMHLAVWLRFSEVVHVFAYKLCTVLAPALQLLEQGLHVSACEASVHGVYQSLQAIRSVSTKTVSHSGQF